MSDLQAGWDAAVEACLTGHEDCSFGGMSPSGGYWLGAEDCPLNHGGTCAWCPEEASTGFAGWGPDGWSVWAVPACGEHAAAWVAEHPEWTRKPEPEAEPAPSSEGFLEELRLARQAWLDSLDPVTRGVVEDYIQRMADEMLYGSGPRREEPEFTGFTGLMDGLAGPVVSAEYVPVLKAPAPQPPRLRFNQATKKWEAQ